MLQEDTRALLLATRDQHDAAQASAIMQEMLRRAKLLQDLSSNPAAQAAERELCRRDPVRWINNWAWTFNPRNAPRGLPTSLPMVLRPTQVEFIHWIQERRRTRTPGVIEKSRDEGMTWVIGAYMVHGWLFEQGFTGLIGSRKLELVDKRGDVNSIFEKLRMIIRHLPAWMLPTGFNEKEQFAESRISHPDPGNPAAITGEGGDNIGRGGRASVAFVDEHAHLPGAESVDAALSQTSEVVLYGSTPAGMANLFAQIRFGGRWSVFTFSWKTNPDKNYTLQLPDGRTVSPWYELAKDSSNDPVLFAQEVDLDYQGSQAGALIPGEWVRSARAWMPTEPFARTRAGLDVADGGADSTTLSIAVGPLVTMCRSIRTVPAHREVGRLCEENHVQQLRYDAIGAGASITATLAADPLPYEVVGVKASHKASNIKYDDNPKVPANERFERRGAELWWALRLRFRKTHELLTGLADHPEDECISLASLPETEDTHTLLRQLGQVLVETTGAGKIRIDKEGKTGKSPDAAESLMLLFAVEEGPKNFRPIGIDLGFM